MASPEIAGKRLDILDEMKGDFLVILIDLSKTTQTSSDTYFRFFKQPYDAEPQIGNHGLNYKGSGDVNNPSSYNPLILNKGINYKFAVIDSSIPNGTQPKLFLRNADTGFTIAGSNINIPTFYGYTDAGYYVSKTFAVDDTINYELFVTYGGWGGGTEPFFGAHADDRK